MTMLNLPPNAEYRIVNPSESLCVVRFKMHINSVATGCDVVAR